MNESLNVVEPVGGREMMRSIFSLFGNQNTHPATHTDTAHSTRQRDDHWNAIFDELVKNFCPKRQAIAKAMKGPHAATFFAVNEW